MNTHLDALEKRAPAEREAALLAALPAQIAHAQKNAPAFAESLKGINAADITSRAALAQLPVVRKYELLEKQKAGKKRMKQIGSVEVPQEAFLAILQVDD